MQGHRLASTLRGIVSVVLAGTAAAACDGKNGASSFGEPGQNTSDAGNDGPYPDPDDPNLSCGALDDYTADLKPAVAVDHVELRTQDQSLDDAGTASTTLISDWGTACATARDAAACRSALEAARLSTGKGWPANRYNGWGIDDRVQFLVYTRGDEVGVVDSTGALVSFLGAIDTLDEARLVLSTASYPLACQTVPFKTGWKRADDGGWIFVTGGGTCGETRRLRMKVAQDGTVVTERNDLLRKTGMACGRRPNGLVAAPTAGAEKSLAAWLAEAAHLEAASVIAFRRLERELRRLGAPRDLYVRARHARSDEIRHARTMAALAKRLGSAPVPVVVHDEITRTLFAIALENAVEGCVRETYGAVVATYQARTAADPELRRVLSRIAQDETRHAALAHDVARWLEPKLTASERAEIVDARAAAIADLRQALRRAPAADVAEVGGMPMPANALALLDLLDEHVLRDAA